MWPNISGPLHTLPSFSTGHSSFLIRPPTPVLRISLTMLRLWTVAGVRVHVKFTVWWAPRSTLPYPEATSAPPLNCKLPKVLQVVFHLLCCRCSFQSELLALVWPLQPASSAQASTAVLHLSDWTPLWRVGRERESEEVLLSTGNGREGRENEREREKQFYIVVVEREEKRDMEGVVAALNVSTLINFTLSAHFFLVINGNITLENINMPEEFLNSYCKVLRLD